MEARAASDHAKSASRYVVADARYAGRSTGAQPAAPRPTAAGLTSPAPTALPSEAAPAPSQRPRVRMRRAPPGTLRFETQAVYDVEATPSGGDLEFDDDFQLDEELKMDFDRTVRAHRRPQRIKYVKCKTRVLPDLLVPYLYAGDRRSRMNAIMDRTGCTIDYCPESPDDDMDMLRPQRVGNLYLMCFLVAAETSGQLEAATRLLHVLVDRVHAHVEYKLATGSVRRSSEAESTPRQDNRGEAHSQHLPPLRREENEYDHLDMMNSEHLKAESVGEAESTGTAYGEERLRTTHESSPERGTMGHLREVRWIDEAEAIGTPVWQDQLHIHSSQARPRLAATRYHRPVYRRVLVDEAGYEVYEPPQYEQLQGYSPHLSGHTSSPPLRRRRFHEPIYHHDSSSEDENNARRTAAMPIRSTRTVAQRGGVAHDGLHHRMPMRGDVTEHSTRRGMKRRLEPYEVEDMYPRHRIIRRGSTSYDYMSDDLEADFFMSGDEAVDDTYSEASSPHRRRHPKRVPVNSQGNRGSQAMHSERNNHKAQVDLQPAQIEHVQGMEKLGVEEPAGTVNLDTLESSGVEADVAPIENKAVCTAPQAGEPKDAVTTSVSIVFDGHSVDSRTLPSDTESVAEVAIAPSMLANSVSTSGCAEDKVASDQNESSRDEGPSISITSVTRGTSPVNYRLSIPVADAHNDNKTENHSSNERLDFSDDVSRHQSVKVQHSTAPNTVSTATRLPTSARAMLNDVMIKRLGSDSLVHSNSNQSRLTLVAVATNLTQLIVEARSHQRLQDLAHAAYRVQVEIGHLRMETGEESNALSDMLDTAIKNAADSAKTVAERVSALHSGLKEVMSSAQLCTNDEETGIHQIRKDDPEELDVEIVHQVHSQPEEVHHPPCDDAKVNDNDATNSGMAALVEETLKGKDRASSNKPKLNIPLEAPTFVSGLVTELERTTGLSAVMTSAQKRLLREISKSDPYYYLHPMVLLDSARKGRGSTCPFGCAGASAHKWERKVVSQISSRMKWFDSVAYSLAKVSGGKELLSRKKMNSTIRKLHLVALQLHCLIAHLFCVRKRVVCREIDSLPTALNNSYYEKRMNGYKSRLKLTLHQQLPPSSTGMSLPTEELVRDTFEFYPELLLSIDIWGFDYRHDETPATKLPVDLLRAAARQSFDFETDTNGLLQGICEELLGILCLWNDFKWGESLESLSTDDIVEFEAKVKTSIRKILEAHASHLLSQWSTQLSSTPALLNHIRLTQTNVYYSEQPVSVGAVPGSSLANQTGLLFMRADEDEEECNEDEKEEEDTVLHDFWRNRFTPSTSSSDTEASDLAKADVSQPLNLSPLREDKLVSAVQTNSDRVLSWTEVYDLRQKCHLLAGKADRLLTEDVSPGDSPQVTTEADVFNLLKRLAQARSIVEDAIHTSEKLVMHSVHHQLDDTDAENSYRDATMGAGSLADVESMSDYSRDEEDALVDALLAGNEVKDRGRRPDSPEQEAEDKDDDTWKQPVLKDLVEIVTSTNQEMSEICGQRARSARVRDKLQSQSLELARQSIQIFQTILNMKP